MGVQDDRRDGMDVRGGLPLAIARRLGHRLTYANVAATLALFCALGGASYAAVSLPANSVGTDQLAFPLGLKSYTGPARSADAFACPPGAPCPPPPLETLASLRVKLKKSSQLLILGQADVEPRSAKHGPTTLGMGLEFGGGATEDHYYHVSDRPTTVTFSEVIPLGAGRHRISLVATAQADSSPGWRVRLDGSITAIALPKLR